MQMEAVPGSNKRELPILQEASQLILPFVELFNSNTSRIKNAPEENLSCDLTPFLFIFIATYWVLLSVKSLINDTSYH